MSREPPVRPLRCTESDCDFPLGGRCSRLHTDPEADCERLVRLARRVSVAVAPTEPGEGPSVEVGDDFDPAPTDDTTAPWTGQHMQYGRFEDLAQHAMPRLVALLGPYDAGKTSLLASFFLQLANGQYGDLPYRFASSRTLLSFDRLVLRANRWKGQAEDQIVDHTTGEAGPQFLHLGLRPLERTARDVVLAPRHIDVLFSDIAGEQAMKWSQKATGSAAVTLGFVRRSDAVLVLADAAKLMRPEGRAYDGEIAGLLRRVADVVRRAPYRPSVSLVFTKIDRVPEFMSGGIRATVPFEEAPWKDLLRAGAIRTAMRALQGQGLDLAAFAVSAFPTAMEQGQSVGVVAPFHHAILRSDRRTAITPVRPPIERNLPAFLTYWATQKEWE